MVTFLARDGNIIDHWTLMDLSEAAYAFETHETSPHIAGMVITNQDPDGIAFDGLMFERAEPTS